MPITPRTVYNTIAVNILDTLFPLRCLACDLRGAYLCAHCLKHFPIRLNQRCPTCHKATTPHGEVCFACTNQNYLDGLFAGSIYRHPLVTRSIHTYKYRFIPGLAEPLGKWLGERILATHLPLPDIFIPVPLHKRRLRFRGFNQSALLAETLAKTLALETLVPVVSNVLLRARSTKPQIKTESRAERQQNLKNAFTLIAGSEASIQGKSIWLIDDVATTGTTLEECARVLKKAGATSVFGIVVAR